MAVSYSHSVLSISFKVEYIIGFVNLMSYACVQNYTSCSVHTGTSLVFFPSLVLKSLPIFTLLTVVLQGEPCGMIKTVICLPHEPGTGLHITIASFPGHSQLDFILHLIFLHNCEIKSGSCLGTRLP